MQERALDRWNEERPAAELLYSELACALGARSFASCRPEAFPGGKEQVALSYFRSGLPSGLRQELDALPAFELTIEAQHPERERIQGCLQALEALAAKSPVLACLLAAHQAATRPVQRPLVMGILNLTPDSFSDGGRWNGTAQALEHAEAMLDAGADIIDVGGESSRPGSEALGAEEEIRRTEPVIKALAARCKVAISIDTSKSRVARAAIAAGASMVNDISAGRFDPEMLGLVASSEVDLVLMHMQKTPKDMQQAPAYKDPVSCVVEHLRKRVSAGLKAGIDARRMVVDPGIGFGKRLHDNILLMRSIGELRSLGLPVLLGASRKSMLGSLSGEQDPSRRDPQTLAAQVYAQLQGAEIHRVHAVQECVAALKISAALGGIESRAAETSTTRSAE